MAENTTREIEEDLVLRRFLVDGRLRSIPARQKKKEVVLRFLFQQFEGERIYTESEVNSVLASYHEDFASLRRYLVDANLLQRENGIYWRPLPEGRGMITMEER